MEDFSLSLCRLTIRNLLSHAQLLGCSLAVSELAMPLPPCSLPGVTWDHTEKSEDPLNEAVRNCSRNPARSRSGASLKRRRLQVGRTLCGTINTVSSMYQQANVISSRAQCFPIILLWKGLSLPL